MIVKAMRAHRVKIYSDFCLVDGVRYDALDAAQAACDRLNAEAFLLAIREPSEEMISAGQEDGNPDDIWRAMIDALIVEIRAAGDQLNKCKNYPWKERDGQPTANDKETC